MDKTPLIIQYLEQVQLWYDSGYFKVTTTKSNPKLTATCYNSNYIDRLGYNRAGSCEFDNKPRDYQIYFSSNNMKVAACDEFSFKLTPKQYDAIIKYNKIDHGLIKNAVICEVSGIISLYDADEVKKATEHTRKDHDKEDIITVKYCRKMINVVYLGCYDIITKSGYWGGYKTKYKDSKIYRVADLADTCYLNSGKHLYYYPENDKVIVRNEKMEEFGFHGKYSEKYSIKEMMSKKYNKGENILLAFSEAIPNPMMDFSILDSYNRKYPCFIGHTNDVDHVAFCVPPEGSGQGVRKFTSSGKLSKIVIDGKPYLDIKTKNNKNVAFTCQTYDYDKTLSKYGNKRSIEFKIISNPNPPKGN